MILGNNRLINIEVISGLSFSTFKVNSGKFKLLLNHIVYSFKSNFNQELLSILINVRKNQNIV